MSEAPTDAESLIAWFTATEIVRHDGSRSPREPHMSRYCAMLLADKIGTPSYYNYRPDDPALWTAERIWSVALEQNLFMNDRFGWIDDMGRFWGCGHAAHELLLHFLDKPVLDAERDGWIRVSMAGGQGSYQPNDRQFRTLMERGLEGLLKRLMAMPKRPRR